MALTAIIERLTIVVAVRFLWTATTKEALDHLSRSVAFRGEQAEEPASLKQLVVATAEKTGTHQEVEQCQDGRRGGGDIGQGRGIEHLGNSLALVGTH